MIHPNNEAMRGQLASFELGEFINFKTTLKNLTRDNAHGVALEHTARRFKFTKLIKIFDNITQMHVIEGNMPQVLIEVRTFYANELHAAILKNYGQEVSEEIKACL